MTTDALPALFSADLAECAALTELAADEVTDIFISALGRAGGSVVNVMSHSFPSTGLTCVLILRESHAVLHTWPESGAINIDIFSCSTRLNSRAAIDDLSRSYGARLLSVQEIARAAGPGRPDPRR